MLLFLSAFPAQAAPSGPVSLDGRPGLLTMAVPVGTATRLITGSVRHGIAEGDVSIRGRTIRETKHETWISAAARLHPHVLFIATHLASSRDTSPTTVGIDGDAGITAGGVHIEVPEKSLAFGGSYTQLTAGDMGRIDLSQLEHLRHVYVTVSDELARNLRGYLQLKEAFSQEYTAVYPDGRQIRVPLKRVVIGTVGAMRRFRTGLTLFGETQMFDDEDFLYYGDDHYSVNAGCRLQYSRFSAELSARSLNRTPTWYFGFSAAH
ncbi:MAG TPA: hypothetical protein PLP29_04085 [Candidatus Ozemobacteraceae bacterium]|mgnify:CR=1 FL=1|nr:hypothetical protein [Candidatus Ozemobacteraceae bacterium]